MKIIKMGNLTTRQNTCPYCNCEYEYDDSDIKTGYELTMSYGYVNCPCCGKVNRITNYNYQPSYPYNPITMYADAAQHIPTIDEDIIRPVQETWFESDKSWRPDKSDIEDKNEKDDEKDE